MMMKPIEKKEDADTSSLLADAIDNIVAHHTTEPAVISTPVVSQITEDVNFEDLHILDGEVENNESNEVLSMAAAALSLNEDEEEVVCDIVGK